MGAHEAKNAQGGNTSVHVADVPDECPLCHAKGTFSPLQLYHNGGGADGHQLEIVYRCANSRCYEVFIGYYEHRANGHFYLAWTDPKKHEPRVFSETIKRISSDFPTIYNQALVAESDGLDQISGPGYRKSLEFLIKDYLVGQTDDEAEQGIIKNEALGACIANRIQDANVKTVAKRAVWLGNDETHYVRKWEEKDLQDLKKLIDLTVHWMEAEALTSELLEDMPDGTVNPGGA